VLAAASDTDTPQGVLAVLTLRSLPDARRPDFVFIPDGVRDPGNLGTMLRTAAAAGAAAAWIPPGTADPYAPKVVRAAMGAHFRLPLEALDWEAIAARLTESELHLYLAASGGGLPYTGANFRRPSALVLGSEAEGVSPAGQALEHTTVHIPMPGQAESLNAAAAAAILLFEVVRQRSPAPR
jgi:TrmH family RNA methyltransferase